jgi:deferrochelatase/peroxidase EfeB
VTATSRRQLIDLFRTLTGRAAFLTAGGTAPPTPLNQPPSDNRLLGPTVLPDDLTVTVALGASLFDGRYGLGPRKPTQLETMRPFTHDNLDPKISDGDLLVQLCASHRDTVGHTMLDLLAHTSGGMRLRWRIDGFRFPPRPVGIPRDWMGFKDGITNPDPTDTAQMNQQVWVQPGPPEPAWTADGTYQVLRIIRMHLDRWNRLPVAEQERIFGRRKISGAPLYATSPTASDELDPSTPMTRRDCSPRSTATSGWPTRRPRRPPRPAPSCAAVSSTTAARMRAETPIWDTRSAASSNSCTPTSSCRPGWRARCWCGTSARSAAGYFFAVPGVGDRHDYYARGLLT